MKVSTVKRLVSSDAGLAHLNRPLSLIRLRNAINVLESKTTRKMPKSEGCEAFKPNAAKPQAIDISTSLFSV